MNRFATATVLALSMALLLPGAAFAAGDEPVGERPYEMVWAERTKDTHPPLIDFENLDGWSVEAENAEARLTRSREQQLWGKYVAKVVYRGAGNSPKFILRPGKPIAIEEPFDSVDFWIYGNNWAWQPSPGTPPVDVRVLFKDRSGRELTVTLGRVRWKEWWVTHRKFPRVEAGATLTGIQVSGGRNKQDRVLYLDNLACYVEPLPPLTFKPRRMRGIDMSPGQTVGTHTGPGRLPFPTREETILPDNLATGSRTQLASDGDAFVFRYTGSDGVLEYRYQPRAGTWSDITAYWPGRGRPLQPLAEGGALFWRKDSAAPDLPEKYDLLECKRVRDTVVAKWRLTKGERTADVAYTLRLWQKSLVIDVRAVGGQIGQVRFGRAVGAERPRLVTLPYLVGEASRPAVLVMGPPSKPLFLMGLVDYYRTNCSKFWFSNQVRKEWVVYNGGATYMPKTDGRYNDCFERFFLTISPRFEEVLPNIPNPKSPWMHVAGERVWRAHGASNRERDLAFWTQVARYGMTKCAITDHETGWRDGGESFTFRTRTAPKKGGDESQAWYSRELRKLGFRYGIYNNYTDFAPVNGHWHPDLVGRHPDGNWKAAWARCYGPKPARAVEFEAMLAPIIQEKFNLSTAYCDVHTAVTPWSRTDFDARVPGAGTMAQQFYCYGEIMLHQKATWNGPVYSEGNNHYYYCGLTDGNYGQDQRAKLPVNPWLVDFDLRKMHPLCCNFGMGSPSMFYGKKVGMGSTPEERGQKLDRFLAATLAFGHTGFLVRAAGQEGMSRSYYMLQQVHKHYAQETAVRIRYHDGKGNLLDTSAAVATDAHKRSQVATLYSNGMLVVVNGHPTESWHYVDRPIDVVLTPNGYFAQLVEKGKAKVYACSTAAQGGPRVDYADTPAYLFADARDAGFRRFPKMACDRALIALRLDAGKFELIPGDGCREFGVDMGGRAATARALDKERQDVGEVETRLARGLVYVTPKEGAFSYVLTPAGEAPVRLKCARTEVVPGETVVVNGKQEHTLRIPADAKPHTRLWQQFEGQWIDFTVLPLAYVTAVLPDPLAPSPQMRIDVVSNWPAAGSGVVEFAGQRKPVALRPGSKVSVPFALKRPEQEGVQELPVRVRIGGRAHVAPLWLKAERDTVQIAGVGDTFEKGICLRGNQEEGVRSETGSHVYGPSSFQCGGQLRKSIGMHPPYKMGVGYSFALLEPVALPAHPAAAVRALVGKGDGSDPGDGILFKLAVVDSGGKETVLAQEQWIEHGWAPLEGDLTPWAGKTVRIKLISDVGPDDNSTGDWARWTLPRIESRTPVIALSVHDTKTQLKHAPGPYPVAGLTVADLRRAKVGWLHFQSLGLQCGGQYVSDAEVCGINIGPMPASKGSSESLGKWSEVAAMPLPKEAIAKLGVVNRFVHLNHGNDCFKVCNFWIELDLADGRRCSSKIATVVYTQPPNWLYAEGTGVPFGTNITVNIMFDAKEQ